MTRSKKQFFSVKLKFLTGQANAHRLIKTKARKSSGIEEPESSRSSAMTATLTVLQNLL